jgi:hypothetical protein
MPELLEQIDQVDGTAYVAVYQPLTASLYQWQMEQESSTFGLWQR